MIIRKCNEYFLIKICKENVKNFNIFDLDSIKSLFQDIFNKLRKKYDLHGLIDVDFYVNEDYGIIIEMIPIDSYFDDIDIRIKIHFSNLFLVEIDSNSILDYEDVYYYNGKFYSNYKDSCDNIVLYKDIDKIIKEGIRIC